MSWATAIARAVGHSRSWLVAALAPVLASARPRHSVRGKMTIAILLSTSAALLSAGAAMLTHDLSVYRESWTSDLAAQAAILAHSAAPALAFDDQEGATRALAALRARAEVLCAGLYGINGELFASYSSNGRDLPPPRVGSPARSRRIAGQSIELRQPVVHDGEIFGSLYFRTRYDIVGRVYAYLGILALVMLISLTVAVALATFLARIVTRPLGSMAAVAQRIVDSRDYSVRALKSTEDEVGIVVDAFNAMVDEVETRAAALEGSNRALREEAAIRRAAEEALEQANSRLEASMAAAEVGSFVWDLKFDRIYIDRNLAVLFDMATTDGVQQNVMEMRKRVHLEDLPVLRAAELACRRTGVFPPVEFRVTRPDDTLRWLAMRGTVHWTAGEASLFSALLIDITERKVAERAVADSERLYRAIGESIDYGVWVCDGAGRNVYASDSFLRLLGVTQAQCSDLGWTGNLHPDERETTVAEWQECVAAPRAWYKEYRILGVDRAYHPILAQGVPIRADDGTVTGWAGINLDIQRLKETEEALRETDRRKDEFLATLAHELRNPLSPIIHAVEALQHEELDETKRRWAREVIARQVRRMGLLLDDLLDISRITRGRLA